MGAGPNVRALARFRVYLQLDGGPIAEWGVGGNDGMSILFWVQYMGRDSHFTEPVFSPLVVLFRHELSLYRKLLYVSCGIESIDIFVE